MSEDIKEIDKKLIEGHEYDGIRELDNPLPRWWLFIFYATIVFAAGYYYYYELNGGPSSAQQLQADLQKMQKKAKPATAQQSQEPTAEELLALVKKPDVLSQGQKLFHEKCSSCHGQAGEGAIGPNLTDAYWLHGDGTPLAIYKVISSGVPSKGMPPWGEVISQDKRKKLAAFVFSLRGTNPPHAKAPQGKKY
ncbi:MAG: nitrogen fixation protein FixP [Bdellovibrio sp.]|nr:MAG: nitrogen fixation protein FixP [Bdellovibrio sp.]